MDLNRLEIFKDELALIKRDDIRQFTIKALYLLPTYIFEIPASSTGKYHPSYALGEGGLVRHTKALVKIAVELFELEQYNFTDEEKDIILSAGILHDGMKSGKEKSKYTVHEHPILVANAIANNEVIMNTVNKDISDRILDAIRSHMGKWNTNPRSEIVLPKPKTEIEKFVHLCDYLASRKFLEVNFDVPTVRR